MTDLAACCILKPLMKPSTAILLASLIGNIVLGAAFVQQGTGNAQKQQKQSQSEYPFLSKRIFIEEPNDIIINFTPLRQVLQQYVTEKEQDIGMYFEYLPSGTSVGVNANKPYFAASLLKVPVAMKAYKLIEEGKLRKDQKVTIQQSDIDKGFGSLWEKGAGTELEIQEVINYALAESDNTADKILRRLVKEKPVSDIFNYLDIPTDVHEGPGAGVSAKDFSSIFKSLYFSSYLNYEHSNEFLDILTKSPYNNRLAADIDKDIKIAHKIGMYKHKEVELDEVHSDCGIIYVPKRQYILCVFSTSNEAEATTTIKDISRIVYQYVTEESKLSH